MFILKSGKERKKKYPYFMNRKSRRKLNRIIEKNDMLES